MMAEPLRRGCAVAALLLGFAASACTSPAPGAPPPLRVGAMFPLHGSAAALAGDELRGAQIAAQLVNGAGGAGGRQISLDVRDVEAAADAPAAASSLAADGVPAIVGAYSSQLSIPAAAAVARRGIVYWETGAVADQLTGQRLPLVFRVGANGADLGSNSARFILGEIAPRLHEQPAALRVLLVTAADAYAASVSQAVRAGVSAAGAHVVFEGVYNPYAPEWGPLLTAIRAIKPDVLVLSSHIPDGISFRRAFVAARVHVKAFLGSTMAQCLPDFGDALGADAIGVFASDRPPDGFNPRALSGPALALYTRFASAWRSQTGREPTEEGIAGFTSAWVLFNDVLPHAASLNPEGIAAAARALDLPQGSLPNGGGVLFSRETHDLGQNTRAAAVIWQWQGVRRHAVVWPALYATGTIELVPLPG